MGRDRAAERVPTQAPSEVRRWKFVRWGSYGGGFRWQALVSTQRTVRSSSTLKATVSVFTSALAGVAFSGCRACVCVMFLRRLLLCTFGCKSLMQTN